MGAAKEMWMNEVEQIGEDYAAGKTDRDEAMKLLWRKGFDAQEASDMLAEAVA